MVVIYKKSIWQNSDIHRVYSYLEQFIHCSIEILRITISLLTINSLKNWKEDMF